MLRLRIVKRDPPSEISPAVTVQDNIEIHPCCKFPIKSELHRDLYDALQEKGYQCLTEYVNSTTNVHVVCPDGHEWAAFAMKLMIPCNNCKECWKINGVTAKEKVAQIIEFRGGTQLAPYHPKVMKIKCEAGHTFERPTASINLGIWCPECPTSRVIRDKIRFHRTAEEKNLTVLSEYRGLSGSVQLMCNKGHICWKTPPNLYNTSGCGECRGLTKKTWETRETGETILRNFVQDKGGVVTGGYINKSTKISIVCDKGHCFNMSPYSVLNARWCSKCAGTCSKQAEEKFARNVKLMNGIMMETYVNARTKVIIQCELGHQFSMNPASVSRGRWCPECRERCPVAAERKLREIVAKKGGTVIGQYINGHAKIDVVCSGGHEFKTTQTQVVSGDRWCKICGQSESRGERAVREYLIKKSLQYNTEVTFNWCPNRRYDFSFSYKDRNFIVEFDGGQHFSYVHHFHKDEERFNRARQRDIDKSKAAMDNGYYLIRIADTDIFDVDEIIEMFIESPELPDKLLVSDYEKYGWLFEALALL
jgi:hypothetical protein